MSIATRNKVLLDGVSGTTYVEYDGTSVNVVVAGTTVQTWNTSGASAFNADSGTVTATGTGGTSTATLSKVAGIVTTDAITTASAGSHVMTITNTLVAAGDLVIGWLVGGTNTRVGIQLETVAAAGAITATIKNNNASAINGTVIFGFLVIKA